MDGDVAAAVVEGGRAAVGGDRQRLAGEGEDGGGAEGDDEAGRDEVELVSSATSGSGRPRRRRALVQAALAALDELEVLDGVGE